MSRKGDCRHVALPAWSLGLVFVALSGCGANSNAPTPDRPTKAVRSSVGSPRSTTSARSHPDGATRVAAQIEPSRAVELSAGKIESTPFAKRRRGKGDRLFETLDPKETGIDFFHKKSESPLVSPELIIGSGVAMGDFDGDGLVDVFLPSSTSSGQLYRNLGDFHFENVTEQAGIVKDPNRWTTGAVFVDVDNDENLDLFVCGHACPDQLYINQGDGKFVERAAEYGLDSSTSSVMMAFADYDRDGDLDAYLVTNHIPPSGEIHYRLEYDPLGVPHVPEKYLEYRDTVFIGNRIYKIILTGQYDYLYRNEGNGAFSDVSESAGIRGERAKIRGNDRGLSATWWDYNDDGWPDLYVANDFYGADRLYHNNCDGTFTDLIATVIPHTPWFSMGSDFGDLNNDGRFDLIGTDMSEYTEYRRKITRRNTQESGWFLDFPVPRQYVRNAVFLNSSAERFHEIAYLTGLESTNWTWSVRLVDLDQDGRQDVHFTNGMSMDLDNNDLKNEALRAGPTDSAAYRRFWAAQPMLRQRNLAFQNLGQLHFKDVSQGWGLDHLGVSFGAAFGDLDNDGDLDVVINNFDDVATVARNCGTDGHSIRIRLRGTISNRWGIGAKVELRAAGEHQVGYLSLARGFMSASDPTLHFGLGGAEVIDELVVRWPSGHRQRFAHLPVDRLYTITEPSAAAAVVQDDQVDPPSQPLFARSKLLGPVKHYEQPFDDFARQPLLPFRLSQLGPGLAVGDVNGDAIDDFCLSGAKGSWPSLLVSSDHGDWSEPSPVFPPWTDDRDVEQTGVLMFDADGDDDLDLFFVGGGNECEPGDESLRDRLYLNDGRGEFSPAPAGQVPDLRDSGSVVAAADYDRDGDLDLYIGGRCIPGGFPKTPSSRLLKNDAGSFHDATTKDGPDLLQSGLVTSALWTDVNADGWIDLMVTHEWGPIKLFVNERGTLRDATEASGLADLHGWWNGIAGRDLDSDGDIDFVATNLGRNTRYRVTYDHPARLYLGDFNHDGKPVLVEGTYDEQNQLVPVGSKAEVERAIPEVEIAFPTFREFASATMADIVGAEALESSLQLSANTVDSVVLRNDGQAHFKVEPLPQLAQLAPGFGVVLNDFDADGMVDIYLVQNSYAPRRETGRMDGGTSALLLGQQDGSFRTMSYQETGLLVPGDAKSLAVSDLNGDGWPDLIVGINDAAVMAFEHQKIPGRQMAAIRLRGRPGNPTAVGARVTIQSDDQFEQTAEVQAGGGYLSQQSAQLYFGLGTQGRVTAVDIRWPDGQSTRYTPQPDEWAIVVDQPQQQTNSATDTSN
jgi:hypothetical protein